MELLQYPHTIKGVLSVLLFLAVSECSGSLRLPNTTVPTHYNLRLDTDIHRGIFEYNGTVQISFKVREATNKIVLHSLRNVISAVKLRNSAGLKVSLKNFELHAEKEFLVVHTAVVLQSSNAPYTLDIEFSNSVDREDRAGFYKSSYVNERGLTRYLAVTHFEPTNARTAFPCFDEPGLKASYDIAISCGREYHALSNAPLRSIQSLVDGKHLFIFDTTPEMQTYLVAWLVSDYVQERVILSRPPLVIGSWSKPTVAHLLSYSVDASKRFIRVLEKYVGERYTMAKLDNVAIKDADFEAGAMENWGLVTYREKLLLYNPATQGQEQRIAVAATIAHEFTHQFFGNLLAPKWWSYLWLNEGFARFYEYYLGDISHPELKLRKRFITGPFRSALDADSSPYIRPMTYYREERKDLKALFDEIAYQKAASVLRMMNYALGERTFQKGIRYYIQTNKARGVVEESDLFNSLARAAEKDAALPNGMSMHEIFSSWSQQPGVPLVTVRRDGNVFHFTQQRYFNPPQDSPSDASWWIPISFSTIRNKTYEKLPAFWMPPNVSRVSFSIPDAGNETVVINPHSTGYYRIRYDAPLLGQLIERLHSDHNTIESVARARLIDDTFNIAQTEGQHYDSVCKLLSYLRQEVDYEPWMALYENVHYVQVMLRSNKQGSDLLRTFVGQLATPLLKNIGYEQRWNESALTHELRSIAVELACDANASCRLAAQRAVEHLAQNSSFHHNTANVALLCKGLQQRMTARQREAYVDQISYKLSHGKTDDPFARLDLEKTLGCLGSDLPKVRSYAKYLFSLDENEYANTLHRLLLTSNVASSDLINAIELELSLRNSNSFDRSVIPKRVVELARYVTDPSEMKLLSSLVATYVPWMATMIEEQLLANRRWIERNGQPLTDALMRYMEV